MPRDPRKPARLRDIVRVRPRGPLPELFGIRWWMLAAALSAVVLALPVLWLRSQVVTFDDLRVQQAASRVHETPMLLWAAEGADGLTVALEPGGNPISGEWSSDSVRFQGSVLLGTYPLDDGATGAHWRGWPIASRMVDGVLWQRFVRNALAQDLDEMGHDPALAGRWSRWWRVSGPVHLRSDGAVVDADGMRVARWGGAGDVLVLCEDSAWRSLQPVVFVRSLEAEREFVDDAEYAGWQAFVHQSGCIVETLFRRPPETRDEPAPPADR